MAVSWRQTHGNPEVLWCSVLQYLTHILRVHVSPSNRASSIRAVHHDFVILKAFGPLICDLKHGASYNGIISQDIPFLITVDMILLQRFIQSLKSYIHLSHRKSG